MGGRACGGSLRDVDSVYEALDAVESAGKPYLEERRATDDPEEQDILAELAEEAMTEEFREVGAILGTDGTYDDYLDAGDGAYLNGVLAHTGDLLAETRDAVVEESAVLGQDVYRGASRGALLGSVVYGEDVGYRSDGLTVVDAVLSGNDVLSRSSGPTLLDTAVYGRDILARTEDPAVVHGHVEGRTVGTRADHPVVMHASLTGRQVLNHATRPVLIDVEITAMNALKGSEGAVLVNTDVDASGRLPEDATVYEDVPGFIVEGIRKRPEPGYVEDIVPSRYHARR